LTGDLSQGDRRALWVAVATATLMIAHQVAGKATRDSLFLLHFDVTWLPTLVIVAAVTSFAGVLLMSALLARLGPMPLVPVTFAVSGMLFMVEWSLADLLPAVVALALYLHMALFGAVLISGFWSVINERFDPRTAKTSVARIAAAATLGGVLGGVISSRVAALLSLEAMLLVLGVMHGLCAFGVGCTRFGAEATLRLRRSEGRQGGLLAGIGIIRGAPFLRSMAGLSACTALASALLDYALKAEASQRFAGGEQLVTFFGGFYAILGVATFLLQGFFGRTVVAGLGLAGSIATLPAAVLGGGAIALALPGLWTVTLLRGAESVLTNSFYRSGFELLYAPLRPDLKRPTKTIIDVASTRFGDFLGGGLLVVVLALVPTPPASLVVALAMVVMALALSLTLALHRGYVSELARSLELGEHAGAGRSPLLAASEGDQERAFLMSRIRALQEHGPDDGADEVPAPVACDSEARIFHDLHLGSVESVRRALANPHFGPLVAPALIPLLADGQMTEEIRQELRWLAPRTIGLLTDALLDPDTDVRVRRELPSVFEILHSPRAVAGLVAGLADADFEVRHTCARVLGRMTGRAPELRPPAEEIWDAVRRELSRGGEAPPASSSMSRLPEQPAPAAHEGPDEPGVDEPAFTSRFACVFTLLLLVLDREAVALTERALAGSDQVQRGTALEYLENVLPEDIRLLIWDQLGIVRAPGAPGRTRSREAAFAALARSADRLREPGGDGQR
jgi:ATP:ADP antiporter, AAA family